jgi:hypothetical protein
MGLRDNIRKNVRNWQNRRDSERLIAQMRKTAGTIGHRVSNANRDTYSSQNDKYKLANLKSYNDIIPRDKTRTKEMVDMVRYIRDLSPDVSLAVWNVLRIGNNGHIVEVTKPTGSADKRGQAYIDDLAARINTDQLVTTQLLSAYTNGAIAEEWALTDNLRDIEGVYPIQPSTIDFRVNDEGEQEMVQMQDDGSYKVLNPEKVFYIPLDPDIGDPYGRSPLTPILQAVFFQVEVLRDLQKVAHNQGHARFDIKVIEKSIIDNIPQAVKQQGPKAVTEFVQAQIAQIEAGFTGLEPDDNFFHTDSVEVNTAGGTAGKSMDFKPLVEVIDRQIISATKQVDIIMGRNAGSTETHTTIQWEIFVNGIESMRRMIKRSLERGYNLALRLQGSTSTAKVTFNEIRTTDRKTDAESEQLEMQNLTYQVQQGWITNDDAAMTHTGHKAVSEPIRSTVTVQEPEEETPAASYRKRVEARKKPKARESVVAVITTDPDELAEYEPNPFVLDIDDEYADQLARYTTAAMEDVETTLSTNLDDIVERLRNNREIVTNVVKSYYGKRKVYAAPEVGEEELREQLEEALVSEEDGDAWANLLADVLLGAAAVSGVIIADVIKKDTGKQYSFLPDADDIVTALMGQANDAGLEIADTSVQRAINTIIDDVTSGDFDIDRTIKNLQNNYGFSKERAELIAVNEILSAGRAGQYYSEQQSGVVEAKVWHGIRDKRQRPAHGAAEGQTKLMDEPFEVGGQQLMYPGDRSLGATVGNTVRCRCSYTRIYAQ